MKPFNRSICLILLLLGTFTQCTIQKRLYNRGFHIEHNRKFRANESTETQHFLSSSDSLSIASTNNDLVLAEEFPTNNIENPKQIPDSTVYITTKKAARDTIYVEAITKREASRQKKQNRLIGVGVPTLILGLVAAGALSQATAAGASLGTFLVLGALGWLCALIAAILLIIFLVFLCIPIADDTDSKKDSNLKSGERSALTVILIVVGIIGVAFLISGLK